MPADRDFELTWKSAAESAPSVGLFREHVGEADYLLAFVTPPVLPQAEVPPRPREIVFVIDNSGSMGGTSIVQAKASLTYALGRLNPADRFNVIRFDHTMDVLFSDTVPADAEHVAQAKAFVAGLQAPRRHRDDPAHEGGAHRPARGRRRDRAPGRVPHRRRDRQRAAAVRHDQRHARPLARVHGRHRLGARTPS